MTQTAVVLCLLVATPLGAQDHSVRLPIGGCEVSLEERSAEKGALLFRNQCELSETELGAALRDLLHRLAAERSPPRGYRSLYLGRVEEYPWLSEALARKAWASPEWDSRKGEHRKGRDNAFVQRILADPALFPTVRKALEAQGLTLAGVLVEKVRVVRASALPFGAQLAQEGIPPNRLLPYDAMLHLRLAEREADP